LVKAPERWVAKQIARVEVSEPEYRAGVSAPDRDPIKAALAANDKRIARLRESIEKKTWEEVMGKLTLADWQRPTLEKGAARFVPGVRFAEPKIRDFVTKWQPILSSIQEAIRAMPEVTDADREKRMIENLRRLKAAKGTWR